MTWLSFVLGFACGALLASIVLLWFAIKIADCMPRFK